MEDNGFWLVVLGGALAIAGGIIGQLVDSRLRRRNKRGELIAARELEACARAYRVLKEVVTLLDRGDPLFRECAERLRSEEPWFWENRLWLPGRSPDAWIGCRNAVSERRKAEAIAQANLAIQKLYKLLGLKTLKPKRLT